MIHNAEQKTLFSDGRFIIGDISRFQTMAFVSYNEPKARQQEIL